MLVPVCPVAVVLLVLGAAGCARSPGPDALLAVDDDERAVVDWVGDGDSLRLVDGRELRLLQIDAPELHGDCYGRAAQLALRRLTPHGTHIMIVARSAAGPPGQVQAAAALRLCRPAQRRRGARTHGRGVAVFLRQRRGRYADDLLDAVAEARAAHRGFWKACPGAKLDPGIGSVTGHS